MSFQAVALPPNLRDMIDARDVAVMSLHKLYAAADEAKRRCEGVANYGMPDGVYPRVNLDDAMRGVDRMAWRSAFRIGGFDMVWDAQAKREFEESIARDKVPEFSESNLRATLLEYLPRRDELFARGLVRVFRTLSRDYRSNDDAAFKVPRKMILSMFAQRSFSRGMQMNYHRTQELVDMMRVSRHFDGQPFDVGDIQAGINRAWADGEFNDGTIRMVPFGNGNVHCYWLKPDVLNKVNATIAGYCGNAIGAARR